MYLPTTNKVILAETLSPSFVGYTFADVAAMLFTRSHPLLLPAFWILLQVRLDPGGCRGQGL